MDGSSHLGGAATTWLPPRSGLPPGREQPPWSFVLLPVAVREEADLRLRGVVDQVGGGQSRPHESHQVMQDQDGPMAIGEHLVKEILDRPRWHGGGPLAGELLEEDHVELLRDPGAPERVFDAGPTGMRWARVPAHHP